MSGLIQVVHAKTAGLHVAFHGNFSGSVCATDPQKLKRLGKSCSLHSKTMFLVGGCGFFVSDVRSGGLLQHLDPLHPALGPDC